jgi:tRNA-splicing ligase RtcB
LCADNHKGYSQPIGGGIAYENYISPSGVGYDIGCGNKAVKTDLHSYELTRRGLNTVMDDIYSMVPFGMGRRQNDNIDHPVIDMIREAPFEHQRNLTQLAASQLGTVGAGNHYVDLFEDEDHMVWVGVHFGSRGFGHKTASGFLAMAQGGKFTDPAHDGEMDSPPVLFHTDSYLGQAYIEAMNLAGAYAYAGRDVVVDRVVYEILGAEITESVHNHHNFAWREEHFGRDFWVIRKGCTPAYPDQRGFVGASMGGTSVILEGLDSEASREALYSTVHGAGRIMSRTQAAGKMKRTNVYRCTARDCSYEVAARDYQQGKTVCPIHRNGRFQKHVYEKKVREGKIDWEAALADLKDKGIVLRGGAADEAPGVYKSLEEVLGYHEGTIKVLHHLRPLGVAMAGQDVKDAYKD